MTDVAVVGQCPIVVCPGGADHLFGSCPHLRRDARQLGQVVRTCTCGDRCDPQDVTVCGWCRRVWTARNGGVAA